MTCGVFGSGSITVHLLRGAAAAMLLVWGATNASAHALVAISAFIGAIVCMRGCPMCWTVGLVETIVARRNRAQSG